MARGLEDVTISGRLAWEILRVLENVDVFEKETGDEEGFGFPVEGLIDRLETAMGKSQDERWHYEIVHPNNDGEDGTMFEQQIEELKAIQDMHGLDLALPIALLFGETPIQAQQASEMLIELAEKCKDADLADQLYAVAEPVHDTRFE